ncbi:bifunctional ADP-dependent NAD(P)H-hydrate dehydratase/NAD(P)H-hydrate epimerase [Aeromicrobium sp. CFBP 8757]|uniref:bifunctional ADP-dependent NAD(P)H-hydrate dehydratase/NAD(P)H-hydrate epimerase n=1 Tax=Aeromicrobium sp. CFBP 8757 TaxID=2775288 RepID=UPI001787004E|nr:bifunctional ADP-dependent NAD(P)H-hydrate dehydratase/NAD(P)H-hydrate epimerase [Aeromicrobium sp. CFBP 8757]
MLTAHTVADVRAAEASLAAGLPDGELMRRAARGLADALDAVPAGEVLLVLVGPGDNGGDALYAAVHLLDRGVRVDLCLLDPGRVHRDGLAAATAAGAQVVDGPGDQRYCLDALFGIGARPGLTGRAAEWAEWVAGARPHTVAVDVPSGVDVDGATLPASSHHVMADATVTFGTYKNALLVSPAAGASGWDDTAIARLVDIGVGPHLPAPSIEAIEATDGHLLVETFDWLRAPTSHKYSRGVVGIRAGSSQYAGAAHLCVAGALTGMAGMVRFVGDAELSRRVVDRAPEVVAGAGRVQAWVVGPGGGDEAEQQLADALDDGVAVVVDASALQHLPDTFDVPALLTPHAGELADMLGTRRDAVEAEPLAHVTEAAERWRTTVLLKGSRTLVASPGRTTRVNLTGSPWLGTAGSGDVLAGLAGSLLASGADPHDAGSLAAFLHGAASVRANHGGPVTATSVAAALPGTLAAFHDGRLDDVRDWRS